MTPQCLNLGLCNAAAVELAKQAGSAPAELTRPILERASLWAAREKFITAPTTTPDSSERLSAELLKEFPPQDTWRHARPAGIFTWRFHGELLSMPPDFEKQVREAKIVRLEFEQGSGGDGGVADQMIALLKSYGIPVHGHVSGFAGSAHADLFVLGSTRRTMRPSARLMVHSTRFVCYGTEQELRRQADLLRGLNERTITAYAERTGRPVAEVAEWHDGKDYWFSSTAALQAGLVDQITD